VLIKTNSNEDLFDTYRELYFLENVLYCDATKGDYDIFLLIQGKNHQELEKIFEQKIKKITGIKEADFLGVGNPMLDDSTNQIIHVAEDALSTDNDGFEKARELNNLVCSYVLVEVEKEKIDQVYPLLRLNENIVYCDYTSGEFNLVLMIHGSYFDEIDKIIEEKIISLNGVLRVKEYPIINMFEM
jgi:DNA-binding Lrp family transcriptional regulator